MNNTTSAKLRTILLAAFLTTGCAGASRDCSSANAGSFGADWIVVQYQANGTPMNCWKLENTAMDNEPHSDGIYWLDPKGHLVHISGWYNRVQVERRSWEEAATAIGVDLSRCKNGKYISETTDGGTH